MAVDWLTRRIRHAVGIVWEARWRRAVFFAWFLFAAWSSIESQLADDIQDDIPGVLSFFAYGPWYMWALIGTGFIIAVTFEASYRSSSSNDGRLPAKDDPVAEAIKGLKKADLEEFFLTSGKLLATGGGPTDFMGDRDSLQELRILGLVEFHHFTGSPATMVGNNTLQMERVARDVPYLSDLGTKTYRALQGAQ